MGRGSSFLQAHRAFKEEAKVEHTDMSLKGGTNGLVENLLFYLVADSEPEQYIVAFDALAAWVDNALDMYRVRPCQQSEPSLSAG